MVKKRGLGKSLDALLSYTHTDVTSIAPEASREEELTSIPVSFLQRGKYQPRRTMDPKALEELTNSIVKQGVIQPLIVRPLPGKNKDSYEIIAGERRWHAAQLAGLTEVPAIIRDIPDEAAIAIALIENIQRENLNPIEEGIALSRLIEEFSMTHQEVAEAVGKSRTNVTNLLRLQALSDDIKNMLAAGELEMGHARTLLTLPEVAQLEAAKMIVARGLSVRDTEQLVKRLQNPGTKAIKPSLAPDLLAFQENLTRHLNMRVAIQSNAKNKSKGKLVIHYRNLKELNHFMRQFEEA